MKYLNKLIVSLGLLTLVMGCDEDNNLGPIPPSGNMVLNVSNLEELPEGWVYEGWIVVDGAPFSTGTFEIDGSGGFTNKTIPVESEKLENATSYFVTIESSDDGDASPSDVTILAGSFGQYEANLTHSNSDAIGFDVSDNANFSGFFLINAFTSATMEDDTSGIWFINNLGGGETAGLDLPVLNNGWKYEGWVVIDGFFVSTGKFTLPNAADESCNYCGDLSGPSFPGEDFLQNAPDGLIFPVNVSGNATIISIEPDPDFSSMPSSFKILSGAIPEASVIEVNTTYGMSNLSVVPPAGKALRFFGFDCNNDGCF
jgi:hypothetical protein